MSAQPTISPQSYEQPPAASPAPEARGSAWSGRARALAMAVVRLAVQTVVVTVLTAALAAGLVVGGLEVGPGLGTEVQAAAAPPARPQIIPPSVPPGAREDWATWTYVDKISQAWGKDWPLVISWFEELDARYPGNPMVLDKLYVSYLEDGRVRELQGDIPGARQRYEQAARYDPDRGVAQERLAELDAQRMAPSR